jgi:hypothetical protein
VSVVAKLVAFVVVLVLCFGAAYAVGAAVGPIDDGEPAGVTTSTTMPMGHGQEHGS